MNDSVTQMTGTIRWQAAGATLPDSEIEVIVALDDGEVCAAYHDGEEWRLTIGTPVNQKVWYWAHFPEAPIPQQPKAEG